MAGFAALTTALHTVGRGDRSEPRQDRASMADVAACPSSHDLMNQVVSRRRPRITKPSIAVANR